MRSPIPISLKVLALALLLFCAAAAWVDVTTARQEAEDATALAERYANTLERKEHQLREVEALHADALANIQDLEAESARVAELAADEADELARLAAGQEQRIEDLEVEVAQLSPGPTGLTLSQQDEIWYAVFSTLAPSANLSTTAAVLQCESGGVPNPHTVRSSTGDVGRAQINQAAHGGKVSARWPSLSFDDAMGDPARNAVMAAVVYNDAGGWSPWACWYIINGRSVPWQ